jgi:hypothetical protein
MKNNNQRLVTSLSFLIAFIFIGCTKQSIAPAREATTPKTSNSNTQSVTFNDITINASQTHVFSVPAISEAIVNSGTVSVYACTNTCNSSMQPNNSSMPSNNSSMLTSNSSMQWETLSTIYGCSNLHVDIVVGQVTMQNNMGNNVTMSFRFDITGN